MELLKLISSSILRPHLLLNKYLGSGQKNEFLFNDFIVQKGKWTVHAF